ncbi:hypothetical protein LOTGIDRAFT_157958 [Lottia gigantea]|uniref:Uncharacterized protein n=1 Tax=Lottia gigantea TaxID=225164 RepID=V4AZU5_LOTGI|nr:hypothetical protein LOTGIDRAFT_157958 [Lottia gigantea]ESP00671.1 hypothetical protein LOTGIDRAFT_157958 [Lottia gigantea]
MDPINVNEIQGLWSYLKSIDWSDHWLKALGAFHLTCITITILSRNSTTAQAFYFAFLLVAVYAAETINKWAAENYRLFSRQQYFDSNGLFISVVYSLPILFNCLVIVILWLRNTVLLMSEVKRLKIKKIIIDDKRREEEKKEK